MDLTSITEHLLATSRHKTSYLEAGPKDGPLIILLHGWPELSWSWRHQLPAMASSRLPGHCAGYAWLRRIKRLRHPRRLRSAACCRGHDRALDALDHAKAVWVGHDWGSPVAWNIATHHPERVIAVASLCVPYFGLERGVDEVIPLVDRGIYPKEKYPAGQWDYWKFYWENFDKATATFDANPRKAIKALFRKGDPAGKSMPARTAIIRQQGGWFGGADEPPDVPLDRDVISERDLQTYAAALERNGFFGPNAWYMNDVANVAYAKQARNEGFIDLPVLFLAAEYDFVSECISSRLAEPMKARCCDLMILSIASGHWMAQEKPIEVNAALSQWLSSRVPNAGLSGK